AYPCADHTAGKQPLRRRPRKTERIETNFPPLGGTAVRPASTEISMVSSDATMAEKRVRGSEEGVPLGDLYWQGGEAQPDAGAEKGQASESSRKVSMR